jgi:hypothetical protein
MQQALEALEANLGNWTAKTKAVEVLRQALKTKYEQARSLTDELMDCVDRLGSEADTVDPRVWDHLLVYAPKPEEEPVAWISESDNLLSWDKFYDHMKPLYTAPPKAAEWVGLTDDVVFELADTNLYEGGKNYGVLAFAKAIEQALKEKNK